MFNLFNKKLGDLIAFVYPVKHILLLFHQGGSNDLFFTFHWTLTLEVERLSRHLVRA